MTNEVGWAKLEGKFFHTLKDGKAEYQGHILAHLGGGYYMVELFEWMTGGVSFTAHRIYNITEMSSGSWVFYEDHEAINEAYKYGGLSSN
jgi:hypothetical protein